MDTTAMADAWFAERDAWRDEVTLLREIVLAAGLTETLKWRQPCYMDRGKNIAIVSWRKDGATLSLLKGALVDDPEARLIQPGAERSGRYLLFADTAQIARERAYIEALLDQAIDVERAGRRVPPLPDTIDYVAELQERLDGDPAFRSAFEALTVGRRRGYNLHFAKAKKSATRVVRIERCAERIFAGKGLLDCICGKSQRYPRCDGSHKKLA